MFDKLDHNKIALALDQTEIVILDIKHIPAFESIMFKPKNFNQGGYDAVYVDKEKKLVRFFQVTRGDKHSLRLEYFYDFLLALSRSDQSFEIEILEIIFVAELNKFEIFKISTITGEGRLKTVKGWEMGKSVDKVLIYGMKGVESA